MQKAEKQSKHGTGSTQKKGVKMKNLIRSSYNVYILFKKFKQESAL